MENPNLKTSSELSKEKLNAMLWSDEEAKLVGSFISGQVPSLEPYKEERNQLWENLSIATDFESNDSSNYLISEARKLLGKLNLKSSVPANTEQPSEDEYLYSAPKRSEVIAQITLAALRKSGIWDNNEHRRVQVSPDFRKDPGKSNYSQNEFSGEEIEKRGYETSENGGPDLITSILAPQFSNKRNLSDNRTRRSLAHEVQHMTRAFTNKKFWEGFEDNALEFGLRKTEVFKVASNMQGSEEIGDLFGQIVSLKENQNENPTIKDLANQIGNGLKESVDKADSGRAINQRYFSANVALLHHLDQLDRLGFGDIPAIRLVALGSFGYTSLEKMPTLIKLGVMNQQKFEQINYVVQNAQSWLTDRSLEGFRLSKLL